MSKTFISNFNWANILNSHLINMTNEYTGFQAYNICKHAAFINFDTGEFLARTGFFDLYNEEFCKIKEIYQLFKKNQNFHKEKSDIEIFLNTEKFTIVHFDFDKDDLYLRNAEGGGVISLAKISNNENLLVFIIAIYHDLLKIQNFEGIEEKQNMGMLVHAVDNTRRYLNNYIEKKKETLC